MDGWSHLIPVSIDWGPGKGDQGPDEAPLVAYTYDGGGNVDEKGVGPGRIRGRKEAYIDWYQPTFT